MFLDDEVTPAVPADDQAAATGDAGTDAGSETTATPEQPAA